MTRELSEWFKNMSDDVKDLNKELHVTPPERNVDPIAEGSPLEEKFAEMWMKTGGPDLEVEYAFHEYRKWRFDFAHPESKVAIELEGGVWSRGRHVRPQGFINDCDKYNAAAEDGWLVFRLPSEMITMRWCYSIQQRIHANMKERSDDNQHVG